MAKSYNRLESLITQESPLTPEDIYATCILTSLPSEWLLCVSSMANKTCVDLSKLIDALQAKDLRQRTSAKDGPSLQSVSAIKTGQPDKGKPKPSNPNRRHCTFCDIEGHDLNRCRNVAGVLAAHKANQTGGRKRPDSKPTAPTPVTKAN
jgi:hypothetical protein